MSQSGATDTTTLVVSRRDRAKDRLEEVAAGHPDVPRLVILKTDVQRRGVHYTGSALRLLDPSLHQVTGTPIPGSRDGRMRPCPESLLMRDGSSIITAPTPQEEDPYWVDGIEGRLWLRDGGDPIEEVEYWPRPDYYGRLTAKGVDYRHIAGARPQGLHISLGPDRLDPEDVAEVVGDALREPGRFSALVLIAGSDPRGQEPFDREVDHCIEILRAIGRNFRSPVFPSQLNGNAYSRRQLERLHARTGLMSFTADLEVLDPVLFQRLCPDKARWVDYEEWQRRLGEAVAVFGRGRVGTGIRAGMELGGPHGYATEEEALGRNLDQVEWLAERGVTTVLSLWRPPSGTFQGRASLDFLIRLAKGFHRIRRSHGLTAEYGDYRRGGNHPDLDLDRLQN